MTGIVLKKTEVAPSSGYSASDFGSYSVEGRDQSSNSLSRCVLYAGTAEEEVKYGKHDRGEFIDALEGREFGSEIYIMPIRAITRYQQWVQGQNRPVATWNNRKEVPPAMLEWKDNGKGVPPTKPQVSESVDVVCVVVSTKGGEPKLEEFPYIIQFKSTGLATFNKTIDKVEAARSAAGKVPGFYRLFGEDSKSPDGKPYKKLTAQPKGEPPQEVIEFAVKVRKNIKTLVSQIADVVDDEGGGSDDEGYTPGHDDN